MQLVEQGKIDLDAPVTQYFPCFKVNDPRSNPITIGQLVSHTSGMPDVINYQWDKAVYDDGAPERYVRSLSGKMLIAAPGENALQQYGLRSAWRRDCESLGDDL